LSLAGDFIDASQRCSAHLHRAGGPAIRCSSNSFCATPKKVVVSCPRLDPKAWCWHAWTGLTLRDRQAFQAAAVIGQRFDVALLRAAHR